MYNCMNQEPQPVLLINYFLITFNFSFEIKTRNQNYPFARCQSVSLDESLSWYDCHLVALYSVLFSSLELVRFESLVCLYV